MRLSMAVDGVSAEVVEMWWHFPFSQWLLHSRTQKATWLEHGGCVCDLVQQYLLSFVDTSAASVSFDWWSVVSAFSIPNDDTLRRPSILRLEKAVSGKLAWEYMDFSSIFPKISQKKVREVKKILPFLQMAFFTRRECKGFWHLHTSEKRKFRLIQKKTSNSTTSKAGDKVYVSQGGSGSTSRGKWFLSPGKEVVNDE